VALAFKKLGFRIEFFLFLKMIHKAIENRHIVSEKQILSPDALKALHPLSPEDIQTIARGQQTSREVLNGEDPRLMVVVGPCSIHDTRSAIEYAQRLADLSLRLRDQLFIVMRVYFEKPRTNIGWQGFINDPYIDQSFEIGTGLKKARSLLIDITRMGLPVAGEALDIVTPPYIQDLLSYTAIGARTVESQSHRKMASGLTSPVGFKNATTGNVQVAINAIRSARNPHRFISINPSGNAAVIQTKGNPDTHLILRGGKEPNYSPKSVKDAEKRMREHDIEPSILIDCSHGNSGKKPSKQITVARNVVDQVLSVSSSIRGIMLESHLKWGNQPIAENPSELTYGLSITDACIDWETTETLLTEMATRLRTSS
jgi:3-deoxy-7-phosphoheptulonate synthase